MEQPDSNYVIGQILFFTVFLVPFAILIGVIARRKGRSGWFGLLGMIPGVNLYVALWMASLQDLKITQAIETLKQQMTDLVP